MKNILQEQKWLGYVLTLAVGILLGALVFRGCGSSHQSYNTQHPSSETEVWTCSMDPQVKQDKPGKCPICGMDLIKARVGEQVSSDIDPDAVMLTDEALALAGVETSVVGSAQGEKEIRLFGKIEPDQRQQQSQSAYVAGRIEQLMVNAVGDQVRQGQTLATIYSPELYTASQELVSALGSEDNSQFSILNSQLIDAAIEKLRLLNISQQQIDEIVKTRKASPYVQLKANTSGTVVRKNVSQGDYVRQGEVLLQIANLNRVWAIFQAYETDLPFLHRGQTVQFTAEALPGQTFTGHITLIDPVLNAQSRTAGVRVELGNAGSQFKPEMLVTGIALASMKKYEDEGVVIPKSAVLWTGKRSVVWVKDEAEGRPLFLLRQIELGPSLPDGYVVLGGLAEGEEIVTNGAFAIDAAAQLEGKRSMMKQD